MQERVFNALHSLLKGRSPSTPIYFRSRDGIRSFALGISGDKLGEPSNSGLYAMKMRGLEDALFQVHKDARDGKIPGVEVLNEKFEDTKSPGNIVRYRFKSDDGEINILLRMDSNYAKGLSPKSGRFSATYPGDVMVTTTIHPPQEFIRKFTSLLDESKGR